MKSQPVYPETLDTAMQRVIGFDTSSLERRLRKAGFIQIRLAEWVDDSDTCFETRRKVIGRMNEVLGLFGITETNWRQHVTGADISTSFAEQGTLIEEMQESQCSPAEYAFSMAEHSLDLADIGEVVGTHLALKGYDDKTVALNSTNEAWWRDDDGLPVWSIRFEVMLNKENHNSA